MSYLEAIQRLHLPPEADQRLRELLESTVKRLLSDTERDELGLLVEVRERLSSLRSKAKKLSDPGAPAPVPGAPAPVNVTLNVRNGLPVVLVPAATRAIDPDAIRRSLQEEGF